MDGLLQQVWHLHFWQIDSIIIVILEEITIDFKQKSELKAPVPSCILFRFLIDSML